MKNIKTFIISKFQISSLRDLFIANGISAEEVEKLSGSDLALRWKAVNLDEIGSKTQKEVFAKAYPFLIGYDLRAQVAPAKEAQSPIHEADTAQEMSSPAAENKSNTSKKGAKAPAEAQA